MAMYDVADLVREMEKLRENVKNTDTGMNEIYNRIRAIEDNFMSVYMTQLEEQKKQTALLEQIAMACSKKPCVFPEGTALSQEELEGAFR